MATAKELGALKSVIKVIEDCKLETEYPQECLQKRIEQLEKQQADWNRTATPPAAKPQQQQQAGRKPTAAPPAAKPQWQQAIEQARQQAKKKKKKKKQAQGKQQSGSERPKTTASVIPTTTSFGVAGSSSVVPPFQQSHLQPAGLLPDQSAAYSSSLTGLYGLPGPNPAVNPYLCSSAALYVLAGAPPGFSLNPNPAASHIYSYDKLPTYGAYGLPPQYHPQ